MDTNALLAVLVQFEERLERAQVATRIDPRDPRLPAGSTPARYAQELWVKATQLLMEDLDLGRFTGLPLAMLQALGNLDRGLIREPLDPADTDETRVSIEDARTMTRAAKVLDLLSAPGPKRLTRKAAAKVIFARLPDPSPFPLPGSIVELRENIQRGRAPPDVLRLWRMPLPPEAGETPADRAEWLLGMLSER